MFPDLSQVTWILWLAFVLLMIVAELLTMHLIFLMVAAGCLIGGLGSWLLGWPWYVEIGLAAVLSALLVFLIRPLFWQLLVRGRPRELTNVDALAGMSARATVPFVDGAGLAKLANGETWTARLTAPLEHTPIEVGARLVVRAVDGATAVVEPETADSRGTGSIRPGETRPDPIPPGTKEV